MIESALLIIYAAVSVGLAVWIRRAFKPRVDWSHPNMRKPVFAGNVRSSGGSGALGAADAINTAALSSASPNAVMAFIIAGAVFVTVEVERTKAKGTYGKHRDVIYK